MPEMPANKRHRDVFDRRADCWIAATHCGVSTAAKHVYFTDEWPGLNTA